MNKKKILVLNDGGKFSNWGIHAATDGIINILRENIENVEFSFLSHWLLHKQYTFDPSIFGKKLFNRNSRIASRIFGSFIEVPRVVDEFDFIADKWLAHDTAKGSVEILKLIENADVVVFNAEGSTYRNNRSAMRALFLLWLSSAKLNKPSFFLNGSVTITSMDPIIPGFIKKTFSQIEGISVREPESYDNLIDKFPILSQKVKMIPDSAFSVEVEKLEPSKRVQKLNLEKDFFCFSTSMLPIDYIKTKDKSAIYHLLKQIQKVVPNLFIFAKDIEDQFLKSLAKDFNATFIGTQYTYEDVLYIFSKSKFLFSGRYHHIIFATKVGCPVIPMDTTSHKIIGLARLFPNLMPKPIDPTNLWDEEENILNHIQNIVSNHNNLKKQYLEISKKYKDTVEQHANVVLENIGKR